MDLKIESRWVPKTSGTKVPVVRFRILRSGDIREIVMEQSSGDAEADSAALDAIRRSLPFPPLPKLVTQDYLDLRYRFVTER